MKRTFLENVTNYIYHNYQDKLDKCCVVFPGKRAAVFFTRNLKKLADKPIWSPELLTINQIFQKLSPLHVSDNLNLLFRLHQVFSKIKKSTEPFDEFYYWGEMILNDFDDIDKYLVNPKDVYQNLIALKEIEEKFDYLTEDQIKSIRTFWKTFEPDKFSEHKKDFLRTWEILYPVYEKFNQLLDEEGIAYEGKIYRQVAENLSQGKEIETKYEYVFFVGLNALNPCEYKVLKNLQRNNKALFFWDYDNYYTENSINEAGFFLRDNIQQFPPPHDFVNNYENFTKVDKEVTFLSVPSDVGQAKFLPQLLENMISEKKGGDLTNTCVVLADEKLLMPVLHSLPEKIDSINITMGYPLIESPVFEFLQQLYDLQRTIRTLKDGNQRFYHKNTISLLLHKYLTVGVESRNSLVEEIKRRNLFFVEKSSLVKDKITGMVFQRINGSSEFSDYLLDILQFVFAGMEKNDLEVATENIEKEFVFQVYLVIKRLKALLSDFNQELENSTFFRILKRAIQSNTVSFIGEPLSGLQVMGVLETRVVDFDNIIILSMNEGTFPKKSVVESFIPYNLRRGFNLPTYEHQDAIYAYYFYRLIQRARKIDMLYNSKTDGLSTGERSRFMHQLKFESDLSIIENNSVSTIKKTQSKPIVIEKNKDILERLQRFVFIPGEENKYFLSPSAINLFMDCSLKFYFRYVARLKEQDEVEEEVDAILFGSILHKAINLIYEPYINKELGTEILQSLIKDNDLLDQVIHQAFNIEYFNVFNPDKYIELSGNNLVIKEIIKKYLKQILSVDIQYAPFVIHSLEKEYRLNMDINNSSETRTVQLGGSIDRIDFYNGVYRIIDYKTGEIKNKFFTVEDLFSEDDKRRNNAVCQVLIYAYIFGKNKSDDFTISPGLYFTKSLFNKAFDYRIEENTGPRKYQKVDFYEPYEQTVLENLRSTVEKIYHPDVAFSQTENLKLCDYCAYRKICDR